MKKIGDLLQNDFGTLSQETGLKLLDFVSLNSPKNMLKTFG